MVTDIKFLAVIKLYLAFLNIYGNTKSVTSNILTKDGSCVNMGAAGQGFFPVEGLNVGLCQARFCPVKVVYSGIVSPLSLIYAARDFAMK